MAQITFIISGGTPDYTVTIEGYMGSPSEWVFNAPGQYTIQVDYQEAYRLLIVDSRGCTASDDYGYTRPDSLINFYIISRVNFNDGTNIYIKDMTPQDACDALLAKCEDTLANGGQGGTGQIANNPPLIGDTVYAYWYTDSLIKFNDGTFIFTTEWNGSRCGVDKYIGHIEDGVITEMILCTPSTTTTTTTLEPTTTTTTTTCDPSKCDYGLLYNWYAVGTEKIAPTGWHVPTDDEWTTLSTYLGGEEVAGGKMKTTGLCDWAIPNTDATNESGFSALPFGWRELWEGAFTEISYYSTWWSSSVIAETWSVCWYTSYDNASLFWDYYDSGHGWGIRCLMDSPEDWYEGLKMTDIDGNNYDTVKIGNQVWTVQNLKVTHYNDGEAIPNVEDDAIWMTLTTGALCAYDNDWNTYVCVPEPTTTTTTTEEPTTTTTTIEPTTTTTTTTLLCEPMICDTTLTVGTDGDGNYGFLRGVAGSISPDCGSVNVVGYMDSQGLLGVVLIDYVCDVTLWINSAGYELTYFGYVPMYGGHTYFIPLVSNPLPSIGETCNVAICGTECTTTTTLEPTTTTTTTCDPSKCDYGLLYNFFAVNTGKLAPTGWHVPTDDEWTTLITYLGGEEVAGGKMKTTGLCDWITPNEGATNESGFSGLPGGSRYYQGGTFFNIGLYSFWWSSTEYSTNFAWFRRLNYDLTTVYRNFLYKNFGFSVRCLRDTYEGWENDVPVVDYDGNEYDVVEIGTQLWLVQNLKTTHYNDGESIPNVTDGTTWSNLTTGALCAYNNDWETYACVPEPITTTTTTLCVRPEGLIQEVFIVGWALKDGIGKVIRDMTPVEACNSFEEFKSYSINDYGSVGYTCCDFASLTIGEDVYYICENTDCIKLPDGNYWYNSSLSTDPQIFSILTLPCVYIITITNGKISAITDPCCSTTTTSTTLEPTTTSTTTEEITTTTSSSTTTSTTLEPTTTTTTTCDPSKCDYGLLYNWYAVDTSKLAPTGWHVPSDSEWTTLTTYLGGEYISGGKLKSICHWEYPNAGATNETGFSALPAGRYYDGGGGGVFMNVNYYCYLWCSAETEGSTIYAWTRTISYGSANVSRGNTIPKRAGQSIRCVRDTYEGWENDVPVVDYDGNEYDVVEIGTQLWLVQNLKTTHYNDGESIPNVEDNTTWDNLTTGALRAYNNDWETYACVPEPTTTTTTTSP